VPASEIQNRGRIRVAALVDGATAHDGAPYVATFTVLRRDTTHAWLDGGALFSAPNVGVSDPGQPTHRLSTSIVSASPSSAFGHPASRG
jgi:hypothetical protein